MRQPLLLLALLLPLAAGSETPPAPHDSPSMTAVTIADPFVLEHAGQFYLYGTYDLNPDAGIPVRVSEDLLHWRVPAAANDGLALHRESVFGDRGFWAPSVVARGDRFYLFYTANERISVAVGDSAAGPFLQEEQKPLLPDLPAIDPHVFIDEDGQAYLFFVRLREGNRIYVAKLSHDLRSLRQESMREILSADRSWENSTGAAWPVTESPSVIKHEDHYYLFYTANDFRDPDYSVGYAIARSPLGPWKKPEANQVLRQAGGFRGTGAAGTLRKSSGDHLLFFHSHGSTSEVRPRRTLFTRFQFLPPENGLPARVQIGEEIRHPRITPVP
jgi:xylan 1,4-beta-xylosidase